MRFDNHADPLTIRNGHYGWRTRFNHVGAQIELPAGLGLIMQAIRGSTIMGPSVNGAHVVENGFDSYFALLTKKHEQHRWSLRFDSLAISDLDTTPLDDNSETGNAVTIAWRFEPEHDWSVGLEWRSMDISRPAFAYFGNPVSSIEKLFSFDVRYRLRKRSSRSSSP